MFTQSTTLIVAFGAFLVWPALGAGSAAAPGGQLPPPAATTPADPSASPAPRTIADLKLDLLWIKPGTFTMGSAAEEPGRDPAEGPAMTVTLTKGFWLGRTAVTQAQYEAFTKSNPSHFTDAGPDAPVENVGEAVAEGGTEGDDVTTGSASQPRAKPYR